MRIYSACLATETNTFSPIPTGLDSFRVIRKSDIDAGQAKWVDVKPIDVWRKNALARGDEFIFSLFAFAQPSGTTVKTAYESLRDELLESLKQAGPVDLVLLYLHGAMVADGYDDCEGDILARVRELVGPKVVVATELDLHCHLTETMLSHADILITFKEYPHTDVDARAEELFSLAMDAQAGVIKPTMTLLDCHMMGMYPTSTPQMRRFIDAMKAAEAEAGVLSVSFGHGFPFGDVPEAGGKIIVVTDNDPALAQRTALTLGKALFSLRHDIGFKPLSMDDALSKAVGIAESATSPVVVADQSDNAGGGAPGDSTFALRWLLDHGVKDAAIGIIYDPEVVRLAKSAGINATLKVRLGGKLCPESGDPLDIVVTVGQWLGDYLHRFPQESGDAVYWPMGDVVALHCQGIDIVVSSQRGQCFSPCIFDDLGIPSRRKRLLIAKSSQHFYGAFAPIASEVIYMAAPGAVAPIMQQIPFERMPTNDKYPWVDDAFTHEMLGPDTEVTN